MIAEIDNVISMFQLQESNLEDPICIRKLFSAFIQRLEGDFSNSSIIHEANKNTINTVEDVWKSEEEIHKLGQFSS